MANSTLTLEDIQAAAKRIAGATINTRFEKSVTLSGIAGCDIYNKFENLQFTASFKDRGALNKLLLLQEGGLATGVVAVSAGNHAKAVAYHAQRLNIPATIVMPVNTPNVKVEDTKSMGARVVLHGNVIDEAAVHAHELVEKEQLVLVHPFDDLDIMAGQGTMALEMLEQEPDLDAIVVPIGGGGLIAGIATAAKALNPAIKIYGVEVEAYPSAYKALRKQGYLANSAAADKQKLSKASKPKSNSKPGVDVGESALPSHHRTGVATIAEGIAVKQPGKRTLEVMQGLVDDIFIVNESGLEEAIYLYLSIEKTVSEGAGAAALAAVLDNKEKFRGLKTALILCGANIDSRILASVLMRRLVKHGRIVQFLVEIDDSPGRLSEISTAVGEFGGNILDVSHQRMFASLPVKCAELCMTVETRDASQTQDILARLKELGYKARVNDFQA
ncbi:MAG: pyridoxal-phosphate dependent enzyme [Pseudohongiellaceae bacterium]